MNNKLSVDEIFDKICKLDEEYEIKSHLPDTDSSYFSNEIINKCNDVELLINELSFDEKKSLVSKLDNEMKKNKGLYPTMVLSSFYESVNGRIMVEEKNKQIEKLKDEKLI